MSVTLDTSNSLIGPCGPLEQSPFGDSLMHASTALLSCTFDCGKNAGGGQTALGGRFNRGGQQKGHIVGVKAYVRRYIDMCICALTTARLW